MKKFTEYTVEELKEEIERLNSTPEVKAARKYNNDLAKVYKLRCLFKQGEQLLKEGEEKK